MLFSNVWKRNNLRIISSGHPADVARGSGRVKFFYWTESLDWGEPCPVLWASADSHKPTCETKQIPRGNFQCRGFCLSHVQGLVLLTINLCGCAETLPEPAWADGEISISCAASSCCCKLFLHLFQWSYVSLEQVWCPGALPLVPCGPAVSPEWGLCLLHTNTCSGSRDLVKNKSWGGWLQRELLRVLFTSSWMKTADTGAITGLKSELEDVRKTGIFTPECLRQSVQKSNNYHVILRILG